MARGRLQHHVSPARQQRRARQHALHRDRDRIGDAHQRGEQAGALHQARAGERLDARADLVGRQALVTEENGQGQIGAAGMVEAGEGPVGDEVEALLAAIVGMGAPADIGKQACGVPETLFCLGFRKADGIDEPARPGPQFLAVSGRARAQQVEVLGRPRAADRAVASPHRASGRACPRARRRPRWRSPSAARGG